MVLDPIPQSLPVHFFGSRPQPPTSLYAYRPHSKPKKLMARGWMVRSWSVCVCVCVWESVRACVFMSFTCVMPSMIHNIYVTWYIVCVRVCAFVYGSNTHEAHQGDIEYEIDILVCHDAQYICDLIYSVCACVCVCIWIQHTWGSSRRYREDEMHT